MTSLHAYRVLPLTVRSGSILLVDGKGQVDYLRWVVFSCWLYYTWYLANQLTIYNTSEYQHTTKCQSAFLGFDFD